MERQSDRNLLFSIVFFYLVGVSSDVPCVLTLHYYYAAAYRGIPCSKDMLVLKRLFHHSYQQQAEHLKFRAVNMFLLPRTSSGQ